MQFASDLLRGLFTYALYPILVISLLTFIVGYIVRIVREGTDVYSRTRRLTGALLPVVVLVFLILISKQEDEPVKLFLESIPSIVHLTVGALIGFMLVTFGRHLMEVGDDTGPSVYSLFLSSCATFIIYSLMRGIFGKLSYFLFGLAVVAGLVVIFKGPPIPKRDPNARPNQVNEDEALKLQEQITRLDGELAAAREETERMRHDLEKVKNYISALWKSKQEFEALRDRFE